MDGKCEEMHGDVGKCAADLSRQRSTILRNGKILQIAELIPDSAVAIQGMSKY